ncbi:MAG: hypothetical protein KBD83_01980 [Gammaproteobacteria bacterium]|nr:hypothetical protein [Gammaproteobacteria bacterium]
MIAWRNSTGFFSRKEETITQLAARLFSDYQEKRPRRDDLNTKIQKIKRQIELLEPTDSEYAIGLLWQLECEAQSAYMAQNSLMRKAKPSLFATTLESLRDEIYAQYSQVADFYALLTAFQEGIPEIIGIQANDVHEKKNLLQERVRENKEHFKTPEEYDDFGEDNLHDEAPIKQEVLAAEKILSVMQKSSETFNEFINAKRSSVLKSSS